MESNEKITKATRLNIKNISLNDLNFWRELRIWINHSMIFVIIYYLLVISIGILLELFLWVLQNKFISISGFKNHWFSKLELWLESEEKLSSRLEPRVHDVFGWDISESESSYSFKIDERFLLMNSNLDVVFPLLFLWDFLIFFHFLSGTFSVSSLGEFCAMRGLYTSSM